MCTATQSLSINSMGESMGEIPTIAPCIMNNSRMPHILVIGTASRDVLHLPTGVIHTIGGAGLYTALAAAHSGARVTLCAPQPREAPNTFAAAAARLHWIGPCVSEDELPRLAIAHHGGGKATLLDAAWGAEMQLSTSDLPTDMHEFDAVHVAALSSASRMREFAHACRARGARLLSAGTYFRLVQQAPDVVRTLIGACDVFFMNDNEARGLFGSVEAVRASHGRHLFVTLGAGGALICTDTAQQRVTAPTVHEVDPTGAGDTFCGTALTALARGATALDAAATSCIVASDMIQAAGPARLL